jgi:hypothetical protein
MRCCVSILLLLLTVAPRVAAAASDASNPVPPPLIVSTSLNPDPALMAKETALLQGYMSNELINVLKDAAADPATWEWAIRDPALFLTEKGYRPPEAVSVRFFTGDQSGPRTAWDTGCPAGLVPITATTLVKVCDKVIYAFICHDNPDGTSFCRLEATCAGNWSFQTQTTTFCGLNLVAGCN